MGNSNTGVPRRKVLKTVGTGVFTAATAPAVTARGNGSKYDGVVYDPVTHEILGRASGQFNSRHDDLRGNLRMDVPDQVATDLRLEHGRVNTNKLQNRGATRVNGHPKTRHGVDERYDDGELPRSIRLTTVGDSVVGYVQRGRTQVAYSMVPKQRGTESLEGLIQRTGFTGATGRSRRGVE